MSQPTRPAPPTPACPSAQPPHLRKLSPQQEHDAPAARRERSYRGVRQRLPPALGVRVGLPAAHSQRRIEQQHALRRPAAKVAVRRDGTPDVVTQLLRATGRRGDAVGVRQWWSEWMRSGCDRPERCRVVHQSDAVWA
eukprot:354625-Chlamydomonas_euryale.AAC.4